MTTTPHRPGNSSPPGQPHPAAPVSPAGAEAHPPEGAEHEPGINTGGPAGGAAAGPAPLAVFRAPGANPASPPASTHPGNGATPPGPDGHPHNPGPDGHTHDLGDADVLSPFLPLVAPGTAPTRRTPPPKQALASHPGPGTPPSGSHGRGVPPAHAPAGPPPHEGSPARHEGVPARHESDRDSLIADSLATA